MDEMVAEDDRFTRSIRIFGNLARELLVEQGLAMPQPAHRSEQGEGFVVRERPIYVEIGLAALASGMKKAGVKANLAFQIQEFPAMPGDVDAVERRLERRESRRCIRGNPADVAVPGRS